MLFEINSLESKIVFIRICYYSFLSFLKFCIDNILFYYNNYFFIFAVIVCLFLSVIVFILFYKAYKAYKLYKITKEIIEYCSLWGDIYPGDINSMTMDDLAIVGPSGELRWDKDCKISPGDGYDEYFYNWNIFNLQDWSESSSEIELREIEFKDLMLKYGFEEFSYQFIPLKIHSSSPTHVNCDLYLGPTIPGSVILETKRLPDAMGSLLVPLTHPTDPVKFPLKKHVELVNCSPTNVEYPGLDGTEDVLFCNMATYYRYYPFNKRISIIYRKYRAAEIKNK